MEGINIQPQPDDYSPKRYIFGRILFSSVENIQNKYSIKDRPFVGTTTMDPIAAHVAAVAADISPGMVVLDPFCGTGSLLIAAAHLGNNIYITVI